MARKPLGCPKIMSTPLPKITYYNIVTAIFIVTVKQNVTKGNFNAKPYNLILAMV